MKTTGYNSTKSWGIAVACGFINCLLQLPKRISAMLFVAFVIRYDTDRQSAAFFITLSVVLKCLAGPLAGFLGEIIDLRNLTIVGCFIASFGIACCYFAENILAMTIFIGIISGFGSAIGQPLLPQILKQHFNKNIANANGVTNSVSSISAFAVIPVFAVLKNIYEVSGALLITSGIMLHSVPVAMLLRNPKYKKLPPSFLVEPSCENDNALSKTTSGFKDSQLNSVNSETHSFSNVVENTELKEFIANESNQTRSIHKPKTDFVHDVVDETIKSKESLKEKQQTISIPNKAAGCEEMNSVRKENHDKASNSTVEQDSIQNKSPTFETNLPEIIYEPNSDCVYNAVKETINILEPSKRIPHTISAPIQTTTSVTLNSISTEKHKNSLQQDFICNQPSTFEKQNKYIKAFKTLLVLKDPTFLVIMLCQSFFSYVCVFLYTILIEVSRDKGFPKSGEHFFLMSLPVAEVIGFTCFGWITDKKHLTVSCYNSIFFFGMGITCITFVLCNNYYLILIATMVYGISFSAIYNAFPSLVYEFIEEKEHSMAIASRFILYAPLIFTMTPLIEYFRGTLGSYDGALYFLTAICIGSSALLLFLPIIAKCSNRKK